MRELSLFSGAGGGLLGTKLLGFQHIGYVEYNDYCQRIIRQRIEDGILDEAPIFGDIRSFIDQGFAESYQGMVDVITAGFPCQPHSQIGKHGAEFDPRNLWPETRAAIQAVRPGQVLLENTKGLLTKRYILTIVSDLEEDGYEVLPPLQLGAHCCDANHKRERIWIVADSARGRLERWFSSFTERQAEDGSVQTLVQVPVWPDVSDPKSHGGFNGLADRVERTRAIGNGQVPGVVRAAWHLLTQ